MIGLGIFMIIEKIIILLNYKKLTDQLSDKIINNININGPISVGEFVQYVFDPDCGYCITKISLVTLVIF